jgi:hypothetical protein
MTNLPDFASMSEADRVEWLANNDASELLALASRATGRWVQVDEQGNEVMQTTAFRLPPSMIAEIDEVVGNDKGGRSGLVRTAIRSYLDRLRQHGPEAA